MSAQVKGAALQGQDTVLVLSSSLTYLSCPMERSGGIIPAKASFAHARVVEGEGLHEHGSCCFRVDVAEVAKASGRALGWRT